MRVIRGLVLLAGASVASSLAASGVAGALAPAMPTLNACGQCVALLAVGLPLAAGTLGAALSVAGAALAAHQWWRDGYVG